MNRYAPSYSPGDRVGRLVIVSAPERIAGRTYVDCACDCGAKCRVRADSLRCGETVSCGCYIREVTARRASHGHTRRGKQSPVYRAWCSMIARCDNAEHHAYVDYGARGIKVCVQWREFEGFLADVGERPAGAHHTGRARYSLDRIDNARGYEPGNVRWTTFTEQNRNRRTTRLTVDMVNEIRGRREHGESVMSIANRLGVNRGTITHVVTRRTWRDVP